MKILLSISYYPPYTSGLSLYAARLAEGLAKLNHPVAVVCLKHREDLPSQETLNQVKINRCPVQLFIGKGGVALTWPFLAFKQVAESDAVIINLPQFEGWIVALWARLQGKKVVGIYHCDVTLPSGVLNAFMQKILDLANHISLMLANRIVTYTADYAEHSRLLPSYLGKTSYVLPPIPQPQIHKQDVAELKAKLPKRSYYVGIAARVAAEKGFEYLFTAIPLLVNEGLDIQIVVAGEQHPLGEEAYSGQLSKLTKQYADRITFLGNLDYSQMGAFYSLLDVLVLPSTNSTEAFGMVQVEALLCQTPVVATDLPGVRVPIQMTGAGLIVPIKSTPELARAIKEVLTHVSKYQPQVNKIAETFSLSSTIKFYDSLLVS